MKSKTPYAEDGFVDPLEISILTIKFYNFVNFNFVLVYIDYMLFDILLGYSGSHQL